MQIIKHYPDTEVLVQCHTLIRDLRGKVQTQHLVTSGDIITLTMKVTMQTR